VISPAQDPQFLAFLRAAGAQEGELAALAAFQKQRLQTSQGLRMPEYDQRLRDTQQAITNDFAARGVSSSGVRSQRLNEAAGDVEHRVQKDRIETLGDLQQIDLTLAQQVAELRRKQADQGLTSTAQSAIGNARGVLSPLGA